MGTTSAHDLTASLLGYTLADRITGFTGVCTGVCIYLTGCHQALLVPPVAADGKLGDAHWFDVQRLEHKTAAAVVVNNGTTPGADLPAPGGGRAP
jgi:hypothetical protein